MPDVEDIVIFFVFFGYLGVILGGEEVGVRTGRFGLVSHFNEIIIKWQ